MSNPNARMSFVSERTKILAVLLKFQRNNLKIVFAQNTLTPELKRSLLKLVRKDLKSLLKERKSLLKVKKYHQRELEIKNGMQKLTPLDSLDLKNDS